MIFNHGKQSIYFQSISSFIFIWSWSLHLSSLLFYHLKYCHHYLKLLKIIYVFIWFISSFICTNFIIFINSIINSNFYHCYYLFNSFSNSLFHRPFRKFFSNDFGFVNLLMVLKFLKHQHIFSLDLQLFISAFLKPFLRKKMKI